MPKITPFLWFDTDGEEAAKFYTSVFPNSRIVEVTRYGSAGPRPEGMVMTVTFELDGQQFIALNGGPEFTFDEAISLEVDCQTQDEVDTYWSTLSAGQFNLTAVADRDACPDVDVFAESVRAALQSLSRSVLMEGAPA